MTERPILFSGPMVQAILAGRKTQTRWIIKPQPVPVGGPFYRPSPSTAPHTWHSVSAAGYIANIQTSPWAEGDHLWVREAWALVPQTAYRCSDGVEQMNKPGCNHDAAVFRAGWERSPPNRWHPSIHMPRWASRITLRVTEVRAERLHAITSADAIAEGCPAHSNSATIDCDTPNPRDDFRDLWNSINGAGAWDANPWVWVVRFERVLP